MSFQAYPSLTGRRRVLLLLLAVAAAVTVMWLLLERPGGLHGPKAQPPGPAPCSAAQTRDCVGGQSDVIAVPAAGTASAVSR